MVSHRIVCLQPSSVERADAVLKDKTPSHCNGFNSKTAENFETWPKKISTTPGIESNTVIRISIHLGMFLTLTYNGILNTRLIMFLNTLGHVFLGLNVLRYVKHKV